MSAESFLDTNLFIHQLEARDDRKSAIADAIIREGVATGNACISYQVVQECLNTVLRKAEVPLDVSGARAYLDHVLTPLLRVSASPHLYHRGLDIQDRYHFGFYDSLIIAAAMEAECTRLLTEDLQDGQVIETVTVMNPFAKT
jgi:predicted nucleic acid-binding protein